jgi:hypothetical protein
LCFHTLPKAFNLDATIHYTYDSQLNPINPQSGANIYDTYTFRVYKCNNPNPPTLIQQFGVGANIQGGPKCDSFTTPLAQNIPACTPIFVTVEILPNSAIGDPYFTLYASYV